MPGLLSTIETAAVKVATSRLMATNVTVLRTGEAVLVVDAPYFPDELAELPAFAGGGDVELFATHSHFDHLMARYAFADATLVIGRPTAEALVADPAAPMRELLEEDARNYVRRSKPLLFGALRGVPVPGTLDVGGREAELVEAPGHTADGTALWWDGVLCCGDYLSDVEIPLISAAGSPDAYRETLERLRPYVREARLVVPGHGTPCAGREALRRLEADLHYLEGFLDAERLPAGRDTARQREIHAANRERHPLKGSDPLSGGDLDPAPPQAPPARKGSARKGSDPLSGGDLDPAPPQAPPARARRRPDGKRKGPKAPPEDAPGVGVVET